MTAWGSVAELLGDDLDDIEFVGRGSSGSVYRATQRSLGRTVAVKVFRRFTGDETDRVLSEARAQAELSWHGNVVSLYDQGITPDGFPYLVMEYAPGGSLQDRVRESGPLADRAWRRVGAELSAALAAAHEAGVVHCDVKPSNVLFAADGSVRLADFGIAKAAGMTSGTLDSIEGSLSYVPPELLDGEKPQPVNDVYSLALTMVFAATGSPVVSPELTLPETVALIRSGVSLPAEAEAIAGPGTAELLADAIQMQRHARPSAVELQGGFDGNAGGPADPVIEGSTSGWRKPGVLVLVCILVAGMLSTLVAAARMTDGASAQETEVDLCAEFESYVTQRRDLMVDVSSELELSNSPVDVVEQLLIVYPNKFAEVIQPFLETVISVGGVSGEVTGNQLSQMTIAENLRTLEGGKGFLYDGQSGSFDPAGLPADLLAPGAMFSEANRFAVQQCPQVSTDVSDVKARMHTAIFSNLNDATFMQGFFEDPRSIEMFDVSNTVLVPSFAWALFENILADNWPWFFELLESNDAIRIAITSEHPYALLEAVARFPELLDTLLQPQWLEELESGIARASVVEQVGMWDLYGPQMSLLGLEEPQ